MANKISDEELEALVQQRRQQNQERDGYVVTIATGHHAHRSEMLLAEPLASDTPLVDPPDQGPLASDDADPPAEVDTAEPETAADPEPQADTTQDISHDAPAGHEAGGGDGSD